MKKIDLGQTITILANVGVITGIAFLGIEISQNTRSLEVGAYQDLIAQITSMNQLSIENPRIWGLANGEASLAELEREDREVARSLIIMVFRHGDMAFHQYDRGLISEERLESAIGVLGINVCRQNFQDVWSTYGTNFVAAYRSYIDSIIDRC